MNMCAANYYPSVEVQINVASFAIAGITDRAIQGAEVKRVLNKRETAIAQAKQEIIRTKFDEWIWKDADRRERLCRIYNDKFNCIRPREYDGCHIKFSGMNPEIALQKHQIDAIAHIMYGGNTLIEDDGTGQAAKGTAQASKWH